MVKLNKLYTRTGDGGTTGLADGTRIAKSDPLMAAIGDVDEANSALGLAIAAFGDAGDPALKARLTVIQNDMFDLGADIATPGEDFTPSDAALRIADSQVARLEREIDAMTDAVAPLRSFVLPGGSPAAAALHLARAIVRRAERGAIAVAAHRPLNPAALVYLNRLSDHLFAMARLVNAQADGDVLWVPGQSR